MKGGDAVPRQKGNATNPTLDKTKPKKKVPQQKQVSQKPKESMWVTKNKYAYQPQAHAPR